MKTVELFAGAGGLAMGMSLAGFKHSAIVEWDKYACDTIRFNRDNNVPIVSNWPTPLEKDVRLVDYKKLGSDIKVVSGGPPCQPFSTGGKHKGKRDERDMFPQVIRAIQELNPKVFIFENVKGLLRNSFSSYFEYILLQLTYPYLKKSNKEHWFDHFKRIEVKQSLSKKNSAQSYNVVFKLLNAANFGVPQKRERVFIVGFRSDLDINWSFPEQTHSEEALLYDKWVTGEYWGRHNITKKNRPTIPNRKRKKIEYLSTPKHQPWVTVRDAIRDLPEPTRSNGHFNDHFYISGAKIYPGHTGSPLDEPAKALKAGNHGVPGGENMIVKDNGKVRYFSIREAARIQTFPDDYILQGSWGQIMRQLGNAVPVKLAEIIATSVAHKLSEVN